MAVRGRKPKPTALKVLEGNPGHRPLNKKEPMLKGRLPRCPDWLEDDAKKEWKRLGKVLAEMGMLTNLDMMAFAGYCQAYARWKGAEEFITQHGDTDAEVMIHKKAKKRLLYPTRISETPRAVPVFRVLHWFLIKINISRIFF